MSPFDRAEYQARIARTRQRMAESGIDVLLITSPENLYYLTGYDAWSFYVHQMGIVALEEEEPLLILRKSDVACARFTAFLDEQRVVGYPEEYIGGRLHPAEFIAGEILERGWGRSVLGVETDSYYFTSRLHRSLEQALPDAQFAVADLLVDWLRIVKSPREIAYLREAGRIADAAMGAAFEAIRSGVRECDAVARITAAQISGVDGAGGDRCDPPLIASGARTSAPHLSWSDEPLALGAVVNVELAGCRRRYYSILARTIVLGEPSPGLTELATVVHAGMEAALDSTRPGKTCEEVEAAWRQVITAAGYEKSSRIGYSTGICYEPSTPERTASFQRGDTTVLEPNMVFHLMCGMWEGEDNLTMSETLVVTESGCELLTSYPRQLLVKA